MPEFQAKELKMRNFFAIIVVAMVAFFTVLTPDMAEAARRQCTCHQGTAVRGCVVHGNKCLGLPAHAHENQRGRRADLPTFCEVNGQLFLVHEPTCKRVRQQVREQERAQRKMIREQERRQRMAERAYRDSAMGVFQQELEREKRSWARRTARDWARGIFR